MAFFQKAARNSGNAAESINCPICNEEYEDEPKQLPCMHTICQECLADIAPRSAMKIFCPIDNQELPLPMGGVTMLPTNYQVIRLLESIHGREAKKERKPKKKRERKVQEKPVRPKSTGEDSGPTLEEQEERMRKQAAEMTEKLRKLLDDKEKELNKKIDEAIAREKRKQSSKGGKDDGKAPPVFILDLTPSRKLMQSMKEDGLATIQGNRKAPTLLSELNTAGVTVTKIRDIPEPNRSFKEAADIERALNIPLQFKALFNPGAVGTGKDGHVAVTDYGNECVWLFGPDGSFLCQVGEDGKGSTECPDGVTFLSDNSIVVSDGPLDGAQTLQLFDISGRFVRCLVEENDEDISFSRISVDKQGRILVACNGDRPCIQVYKKVGKDYNLDTEVGIGEIRCPEKAFFHDGKYVVADSNGNDNRSMIKVFDKEGNLLQSFDEDKYCMGQRDDMGIDITYPIRLAFDWSNNTMLAYHGVPREVRVLKLDGSQVSSTNTVSGARDIALTKDKKIVVTCGQDSFLKRSVQVLKYK